MGDGAGGDGPIGDRPGHAGWCHLKLSLELHREGHQLQSREDHRDWVSYEATRWGHQVSRVHHCEILGDTD